MTFEKWWNELTTREQNSMDREGAEAAWEFGKEEEAEAHAVAIKAAYARIDELEKELVKTEPVAWMIEPIKGVAHKNMVRELSFYEPVAKADYVKVQLYRKEDV